ncbi:MAG TPA: F0F1 ATP synthase subunit B [Patescibacteria group bacterium]|nr:F0F1 ATP synthase subunit B [Patescibacteria group bacterium]
MQQLLSNFGVQPLLLAAQIVNFLIVLYLLNRFAFKPILRILDERKKTIAESIKNAAETEKLLQLTEQKEKAILKKAQQQAQQLLADAKAQAEATQEEAEEKTRALTEKMLSDAKRQIDEQAKTIEKQLAKHTVEVALSLLEKSLTGIFDEREQKSVLIKASKQLEKEVR